MNLLLAQSTSLPNTGPISLRNCCVLDQTGPVGVGGVMAHDRPVRDKGVVLWARAKHMARKKKKKPVRTRARKAKRARKPQWHRTEPLDELTKKYMDQGLPADQARERARAELRANNREDWWSG